MDRENTEGEELAREKTKSFCHRLRRKEQVLNKKKIFLVSLV